MIAPHTPGPWRVWCGMIFAGQTQIADVRGWGHLTGVGAMNLPTDKAVAIQDANGRVLAAGPDLLTACEAAENWLDNFGEESDPGAMHLLEILRAAIAKTKGEAEQREGAAAVTALDVHGGDQ